MGHMCNWLTAPAFLDSLLVRLSFPRNPKNTRKRATTVSLSPIMPDLPLDIMAEILCRLPVKNLLCCRCVSKPWCALIDGTNFVKLYLQHSMETSSNLNIVLKSSRLRCIDFDSLDSAKELNHPLMCYDHGVKILGSCNGLLCISNVVDDMALWNPSTKTHRIVPFLPVELKRYFGTCSCRVSVFGFGYDVIHDDYKIVRIAQFEGVDRKSFESEVKVYSLRRNYWKRIGDMPFCVHYPGANGVFAGGALHWMVSQNPESNLTNVIVALDLGVEEYREVPQPLEYTDGGFQLELGVLRGSICLLANFKNEHVDVWVMNEYGVKESWTKHFSVAKDQVIGILRSLKPLAYSKSGNEVLMEVDNMYLFWYDLRRNAVKHVSIDGLPITFESVICVRSLISLNVNRRLTRTQHEDEEMNNNKRDDFLSKGFKLVL